MRIPHPFLLRLAHVMADFYHGIWQVRFRRLDNLAMIDFENSVNTEITSDRVSCYICSTYPNLRNYKSIPVLCQTGSSVLGTDEKSD